MDMKLIFLILFAGLINTIAAGVKHKRNTVSKVKDVVNAVLLGEEKLETFRRNIQSDKVTAEQILAKKKRSHELESEAVVRLEATKRLMEKTGLTEKELQDDKIIETAFRELVCEDDSVVCPSGSDRKYRTIDGACNNRDHDNWGRAFTAQERLLPPTYAPGNQPREAKDPSKTLPAARRISNELFKTLSTTYDSKITGLVAAWGQLIDHDFTKTPTAGNFDCCDETEAATNTECFPMEVPADDERFDTCLNFVRSAQFTSDNCISGTREQINELSAYIDATFAYGTTEDELNTLRDPTNTYLLDTHEPGNLLPEGPSFCFPQTATDYCQHAGDTRVNVIPPLGSMHTLMMREHNRIAQILKDRNTHGWDDETIFQETRKIIGAITQHITYNEWLPTVIGHEAMGEYELWVSKDQYEETYSRNIKAQMLNSFAVAALRYGHSILTPTIGYRDADMNYEEFDMKDQILNPHMVVQNNGSRISDLIRFVHLDAATAPDSKFEEDIRDFLFGNHDLPARNVQRGRDHGVPDYLSFRNKCGLSRDLSDIPQSDRDIITQLYDDVNDIDLYVGGMSERKVSGGDVGPTFACIFGEQFRRLKRGDSYWYELPPNRGSPPLKGFSLEQLQSIKNVRMSGLLCTNFDLNVAQVDPFVQFKDTNCQPLTKRRHGGGGGSGGNNGQQPPPNNDPPCNPLLICSDPLFRPINLDPWIN